jgi:hypothetical protein
MKLFSSLLTLWANELMFVLDKSLHPRLMFTGKARESLKRELSPRSHIVE